MGHMSTGGGGRARSAQNDDVICTCVPHTSGADFSFAARVVLDVYWTVEAVVFTALFGPYILCSTCFSRTVNGSTAQAAYNIYLCIT